MNKKKDTKERKGQVWERFLRRNLRNRFKVERPWERQRTQEERHYSKIYYPDFIINDHFIVECKSSYGDSITIYKETVKKMSEYREKFLPDGECLIISEFRDREKNISDIYVFRPTFIHRYILNKNKLAKLILKPDFFGLGKEITLEDFFTSLPKDYPSK